MLKALKRFFPSRLWLMKNSLTWNKISSRIYSSWPSFFSLNICFIDPAVMKNSLGQIIVRKLSMNRKFKMLSVLKAHISGVSGTGILSLAMYASKFWRACGSSLLWSRYWICSKSLFNLDCEVMLLHIKN